MKDNNNEISDFNRAYGIENNEMLDPVEERRSLDTDLSDIAFQCDNFSATSDVEKPKSNFLMAIIGGLSAAIICLIIWVTITVLTRHQVPFMALLIGAGVGYAVLKCGKSETPAYGILSAILSLLACLFGNIISTFLILSLYNDFSFIDDLSYLNVHNFTYIEALSYLTFQTLVNLSIIGFEWFDIIFYFLVMYVGYAFVTPKKAR